MALSLAFAGLDLSGRPYAVENVEGLVGLPEIDDSDLPLVGQSGMVKGRDFYRGRTVTITVDVYADDDASYSAAMAALTNAFGYSMSTEAALTFTIPGVAQGQPATWLGRCRKASQALPTGQIGTHSGQFVAELFGTDPLKYGASSHSVSLSIVVGSGGFTWPLTWPLIWVGAGGGSGVVISNAGNAPAAPVVRLLGPLVNPDVTNQNTGQVVSLNLTVALGDFLDLDFAAHSALLNGTVNRYPSLIRAEWWTLAPGNTTVVLTADSGSTGTATITWKDSYL
jgi:hypothetical protein